MKKTTDHMRHRIVIADGSEQSCAAFNRILEGNGCVVIRVRTGTEALNAVLQTIPDVVIAAAKLPDTNGLKLLKDIRETAPGVPVILVTDSGNLQAAVAAMKEGAYDYIRKPVSDDEAGALMRKVLQQKKTAGETGLLQERSRETMRERFHNIVGKSASMQKIYTLIETISTTRATILINGESGTGKRLIAHAIHQYNAQERGKPFVEVSCGALTETLLESELFGHVKGAFTGAIRDRAGRFELAHYGTIFLDEIDAFSPALQVKLLRVLQEGEFERVGDTKTLKVDVRVVAATNQNLLELIAQNKFRKDLYYRLNIISIDLPPLRERIEDIPLLVKEFIDRHTVSVEKKITGITEETLAILQRYHWPGNIRELENVIERASILSKGPLITPDDLPEMVTASAKAGKAAADEPRDGNGGDAALGLKESLRSPEKMLIVRALDLSNWNRNEAAKILGINRTTLYKKMQSFGLLKKRRPAE